MKKTILITIPNGAVSHGFLRTTFLRDLLAGDVRVVLVVPPYRREYYVEEFSGNPDVLIEAAPVHRYKKFEDLANRFLRQSIPSRTIYNRQAHALAEGKTAFRFGAFIFTRTLWFLGHLRPWRKLLRLGYRFTPCAAYLPLIDTHKPNAIFVTTLYDRMDLGLMKAARKRKVPILGMTKSWDSITSKCFMAVPPDRLLVQNVVLADDAVRYADMRRDSIEICSVPQFDFYFDTDILLPREKFLQAVGLPSRAKYVLFGGEGLDLFPGECEVLRLLSENMQADLLLKDFTILYRPHPNYEWCRTETRVCPNVLLAESSTRIADTAGGWEFTKSDIQFLVNSVYHAEMLITMASTLVIEAALFDRPLVGIAFDGKEKKPFFSSVERYYHTNHFTNITETKGIRIALDGASLASHVRAYAQDPTLDARGRKKIQAQQVPFVDGKAALRVAEAVSRFLNRKI